ncbi:MAG: uroporphyrinogen-III C-methyltransferase [Peptoniphilus sp. oral taxon 375]|nr:uroporphyrinogen-III C-methyltransferase [Peptoniphilus sp. oral taxon 375]
MTKGKVYITGAGIGPSDLITQRALKVLEDCDVVIYDRLLNPDLIAPYLDKKEVYYAGKAANNHYLTQDQTNALLVEKALEGKKVLRLKGGDPYVFGRGGEEALYCKDHGIEFEVIPGVTSGIVSLMYAGIPATHRGKSTSVSFITGHREKGDPGDFHSYAKLEGTLVFYMGLNNLPLITGELLEAGMDPKRPCAVIMHGGYPDQKVLTSTVENICQDIQGKGFGSPSLIVIGEVVDLRKDLNFYESRPLFGKRIVITRARSQASSLAQALRDLGAQVMEAPCIQLQAVHKKTLEKRILAQDFTHVIFHSVNALEIFMDSYLGLRDLRDLAPVKLCVIGEKTEKALRSYGLKADLVPKDYVGEALVQALKEDPSPDKKLFIPHSNKSRPELMDQYKDLGQVDDLVIYRNIKPEKMEDLSGPIDYILFTSSSTVDNFVDHYGKELLEDAKIVSIGPITSQAIQAHGLEIAGCSEKATIPSMVQWIKEDADHAHAKN